MSDTPAILRPQAKWGNYFFYQKADVLYQLTVAFCRRFLPKSGDRTVDQMVQAARSGKQNIVEGCADGVTSTEIELRLLNVARGSLKELAEDYADYLKAHALSTWTAGHPRFDPMLAFCRVHNKLPDYEPLFSKCGDEELANLALTLCHMVDRMLSTHLKNKESDFIEHGGIKERMTAARLARRRTQNEEIAALREENAALRHEIARLKAQVAALQPGFASSSSPASSSSLVSPSRFASPASLPKPAGPATPKGSCP